MNHFAAMKSPVPVTAGDAKSPLFCPKPRRPVAPLRCHQSGYSDAGVDLLDLLLSKGDESSLLAASPLFCGSPPRRASNPVVHDRLFGKDCPPMPTWLAVAPAATPATPVPVVAWPSPCPPAPAVVAWPSPCPAPAVVARPIPRPAPVQPTMSPRSAAGCSRARFGLQPAAVRVEGFACLDGGRGGRHSHGIAAMA